MLMRKWTKATVASTLFRFGSLAATSTVQAGTLVPKPIPVSPIAAPLTTNDIGADIIKVRRGYRHGRRHAKRHGRRFRGHRRFRFGHRRRGLRHAYRFGRRFGYGRRFYRHRLYGRRYYNPGFRFGLHFH